MSKFLRLRVLKEDKGSKYPLYIEVDYYAYRFFGIPAGQYTVKYFKKEVNGGIVYSPFQQGLNCLSYEVMRELELQISLEKD